MEKKNRKKKVFVSIFLLSCTLLFAGCGKKQSEYEEQETSQTEESEAIITVGFAQSGSGATWNAANIDSIKQNCSEENGIRLILENANDSLDNQIASIRSFIEQDVDVIGFSPLVSDGWDDVLREAKAAGIPVILVDRTLNTSDDTLYTCWVGSDFLLEGYKAADWIIEYMKTNHTGTEKIKVALFQGTIGASAEVGRTQGVEEMLENAGNYEFVYKASGDFKYDGGVENMEKVLEQNLDIDILISENDDMTLGAIEVMERNGIRPGKDIVIVSFDGVRAAFEAMIEGKINCTMECNPLSGKPFVDAIRKVLNGDPVDKRVYVQEELFLADTAADYIENRKY